MPLPSFAGARAVQCVPTRSRSPSGHRREPAWAGDGAGAGDPEPSDTRRGQRAQVPAGKVVAILGAGRGSRWLAGLSSLCTRCLVSAVMGCFSRPSP